MMNMIKHFFRRYILSAIGILMLFLAVNILLILAIFSVLFFNGGLDGSFPVDELSEHISNRDGLLSSDTVAQKLISEGNVWAMILDNNGCVIWDENMPDDLPRQYSLQDVASFSRWYLDDYPVSIWERDDGLLVVGYEAGSLWKSRITFDADYVAPLFYCSIGIFLANIIIVILLFIHNTRKLEKSIGPILNGIQQLSKGKPVHLDESGKLSEIKSGLNKAGDYLMKKDNTRAVWIRGISHDIRTPLSIILAYSSEMEETPTLPETTRKQAGIILRQSEKLKNLVSDLNLTTKLEYSMQAIHKQNMDAVELSRQVVSGILNDGIPEQFEIEFYEEQPGKILQLNGDNLLLQRMLGNLIHNSIVHNPTGCIIGFSVGSHENNCIFIVSDNGHGMSEPQLNALNSNEDIFSSQKSEGDTEHGLGLKIVRQIVKAHQGTIHFSAINPHGLNVVITLQIE